MSQRRTTRRWVAALMASVLAGWACLLPVQRAEAALVGTEAVLHAERAEELRQTWLAELRRAEARSVLESHGVSPEEAEARIRSLTDAEAIALGERFAELPAGQGLEGVIIAVVVIFALFIILDAFGVTDVFPGIDPKP